MAFRQAFSAILESNIFFVVSKYIFYMFIILIHH